MGSESISRSPYAAGDLNVADILLDLRRRGANLVSHGLKSLEQHLCGTRDVLTAWHQPLRVCLAGFLHSGYSTDSFEHPLFDIGNRSQMRELIGKEAEKIVYVFCSIQRQDLFDALRQRGGEISEHLMLANRRGGPALTLTRRDVGDLLVLYMANTAEQSCVSDGAPGRWIAHAAKLGWWAKNLAVVVPPVFDGCTAIVSEESEDHLLEGYSAALRNVAANPGGAMANLAEAVAGAACVPEPLIWWGFLSIAAGVPSLGSVCAPPCR